MGTLRLGFLQALAGVCPAPKAAVRLLTTKQNWLRLPRAAADDSHPCLPHRVREEGWPHSTCPTSSYEVTETKCRAGVDAPRASHTRGACVHSTCRLALFAWNVFHSCSKKHPRGWEAGLSVCVSHYLTGRNLVGGGGEPPCSEDVAGWSSSFPAFLLNLFPPPVPGCSSPPPPKFNTLSQHRSGLAVGAAHGPGTGGKPRQRVLFWMREKQLHRCQPGRLLPDRRHGGWPVSATSNLSDSCAVRRGQERGSKGTCCLFSLPQPAAAGSQ